MLRSTPAFLQPPHTAAELVELSDGWMPEESVALSFTWLSHSPVKDSRSADRVVRKPSLLLQGRKTNDAERTLSGGMNTTRQLEFALPDTSPGWHLDSRGCEKALRDRLIW